MTILVAQISSRNQIGRFLNQMGLVGSAVEVGTHKGEFANVILQTWEGQRLYCVDPWKNLPGYENQARFLWGNGNRHEDYIDAKARLRVHQERAILIKSISSVAVQAFSDNLLDFVYLDGNHEPPYVEEDIRLWWPKIKSGGILSGHDIICPGEADGSWGRYIQPELLKFANERNLDVQLIVEENGLPWSYLIFKP